MWTSSIHTFELKEECSINNLPNQIMAKAISDRFVFNILCVGETACGHSLKALGLVTMKHLDNKVNIIPVIAKSDTISQSELQRFKHNILNILYSSGVKIYWFPTDDETLAEENLKANNLLPSAVVGSNETIKVRNQYVRAKQYPWGVVQFENENHCDFKKLRDSLIEKRC